MEGQGFDFPQRNENKRIQFGDLWPDLAENERPRVIVIPGPGGGVEEIWFGSYHFDNDASNYNLSRALFVELDPRAAKDLGKNNWSASIEGDFFDLIKMVEGIEGQIDEIWMKNFRPMDKADLEMLEVMMRLLKPGGEGILVDHVSRYSNQERSELRNLFEKAGFEIEDVEAKSDDHPYLDMVRRADTLGMNDERKEEFYERLTVIKFRKK